MANSIFGGIHNSIVIQARDLLAAAGSVEREYDWPWQRMVHDAEVWKHTSPGQDTRADAVAAAGRLAALLVDIRPDPWLDRTFAERFHRRVGGLRKRLGLELGPAEAALLVLVPFCTRSCGRVPRLRFVKACPWSTRTSSGSTRGWWA